MSLLFDGKAFAQLKENKLREEVAILSRKGIQLRVKTFVFTEDEGSRLYTRLKKAAAERIGIIYEPVEHSLSDSLERIVKEIEIASHDPSITGVMVQKPAKSSWKNEKMEFSLWWGELTKAIDPAKDVDCLTDTNLHSIQSGEGIILPATVQAVVSILEEAKYKLHVSDEDWEQKSVVILGRSDIVGKPLSWVLLGHHKRVDIFGKSDMPNTVRTYDIVISAVGKEALVAGDMVPDGVVAIDVGAPKGDIEFESVEPRAAFLTPVPGGVGPVTVVSLMENVLEIYRRSHGRYSK